MKWRKSSYSTENGEECLEVADNIPSTIPVRDSKHPHGPRLFVPAPSWTEFIAAVQDGTLRHP